MAVSALPPVALACVTEVCGVSQESESSASGRHDSRNRPLTDDSTVCTSECEKESLLGYVLLYSCVVQSCPLRNVGICGDYT